MRVDRSQSLFYFVPQEKNLTAKQARLGKTLDVTSIYIAKKSD